MQDKQKVTLYLSADLHRQLKIRSAIDQEPMSDLAERAISFYLSHAEIVEASGIGHTHQVYNCPECSQAVVVRSGELLAIGGSHNCTTKTEADKADSQDEELVVCQ
ncbi:hypothetical protein V2H45_07120 [Tumidithrix elongata RA019]|uniref:Ribbon-helix-helix protein CopG domain-containing protein n=1 Tax=Tumidithrix elongata BACA0141 TaxID=2716417 RepID=A0AAW9Q1L7_9CYAN|nr:hypothetical protein [Tumidithrix elongata RA019]